MFVLNRHRRWCSEGRLAGWAAAVLSLALAPLCQSSAAARQPAYLGESLTYTASYQGVLSGGNRLDIADVHIITDPKPTPFNGEKAYRTSLVVSSAGHGALERVYPLRYEYSSLLSTDLRRSLLFDQRSGRNEAHRTVVWFDWKHDQLASFDKDSGAEHPGRGGSNRRAHAATVPSTLALQLLAEIGIKADAGRYVAKTIKGPPFPNHLLDRLALLQVLRLQNFERIGSIQLPVSDGKSLYEYRASLVGKEPMEVDGVRRQTFHLRLTAFDVIKGAQADQAPVDVWLAADEAHTPVRFLSDQKLGRIDIRLKTAVENTADTPSWSVRRLAARGR